MVAHIRTVPASVISTLVDVISGFDHTRIITDTIGLTDLISLLGFPDETNTGYPGWPSTAGLTPTGSFSTSSDGQIIEDLEVTGEITVNHDNVLIRRCQINGRIYILGPTGCVIEDCAFDGTDMVAESLVLFHNYTIRRCHFYNCGECISANGATHIYDSYFHDFNDYVGLPWEAHQDVIQAENSGGDVIIDHNTMLMNVDGANACVQIGANPISQPITISNNLVGGGTFALRLGDCADALNNWFTTSLYANGGATGPFLFDGGTATRVNNRWIDGPNAGELVDGTG